MLPFVARRVAVSIVMLAATSVVLFVLLRVIPGDPIITRLGSNSGVSAATVAKVRRELGLEQPIVEQYFHWVGGMFRGDFGRSYFSQFPVTTLIGQRIGPTLELAIATVLLDVLLAVPVAIRCAIRPNGFFDRLAGLLASFGMAFPPFVAGILLLTVFSVHLRWLPNSGFVALSDSPIKNLKTIALPALTLATVTAPLVMRYLRSQLIEELRASYIRTAASKGAGRSRVIVRHALRNALVPALTMLGLIVGYTLGGVVIVEYVFGINGLGSLAVQAAIQRDYGVLQGVVLLLGSAFILTSLVVDVLSAALDPRIRARLTDD